MATETGWICPICWDARDDVADVIPCGHQFCLACSVRCAGMAAECPLCRQPITMVSFPLPGEDFHLQCVVTRVRNTAGTSSSSSSSSITISPHASSSSSDIFPSPHLSSSSSDGSTSPLPSSSNFGTFTSPHPSSSSSDGSTSPHSSSSSSDGSTSPHSSSSSSDGSSPTRSQRGTLDLQLPSSSSSAGSNLEEEAGTLEAALRGGPSHPPSVPILAEQEQPQEGPGQIVEVAGPSAQGSSHSLSAPGQGRERSPRGSRRPLKRRGSSSEDSSPPCKRPPCQHH